MSSASELYETDYGAWARRQIELLNGRRFADLDIAHLVEELEDMGRSERNELESRLAILLAHLLKWQFQYAQLAERWREFKRGSWRSTIIEQRDRIGKRLQKSPGLRSELASWPPWRARPMGTPSDLRARKAACPPAISLGNAPIPWKRSWTTVSFRRPAADRSYRALGVTWDRVMQSSISQPFPEPVAASCGSMRTAPGSDGSDAPGSESKAPRCRDAFEDPVSVEFATRHRTYPRDLSDRILPRATPIAWKQWVTASWSLAHTLL